MFHFRRAAKALCFLVGWSTFAPAQVMDEAPTTPAAFLPGGMLGVQIGSSWRAVRRNPALTELLCQASSKKVPLFDEVCFFKTSSRVFGAEIHDGFVVRKGDRVIIIGTGIAIKNLDDPLAEAVMRGFQSEVHAKFQQTGDDVLFVNLPERHLTPQEMAGFSESAPVLLVELQPEETELAVYYGYLAPVNAFSALASNASN